MKKLILVVALMVSGSCFGAVTHVASGQGFCSGTVTFGGNMASGCGSVVTKAFTYTATGTGNGVLVYISCADNAGTPSAVSLTATGWSFTQVGTIIGSTTAGFGALFKAYAPNTSAATMTQTWTATNCGASGATFINDLIDEWAGMDLTNFVDANNAATGSATNCGGALVANVTPTVANDGLWAGCNDSVSAVGGSFTKGADDTSTDWTEWKILAGGSGVAQGPSFTGASGSYVIFMVAIKPAGGAAPTTGFSKKDKLEKFWPQ